MPFLRRNKTEGRKDGKKERRKWKIDTFYMPIVYGDLILLL
jgi:hypothetical protein